jgi:hypothetical protein
MRALTVAVLAGVLAFAATSVIAGNKGGVGKASTAPSAGHMSETGVRTTNGQWSPDRDQGLDRAQERRSDSALEHSNALEPHPEHGNPSGKAKGKR